MLFLGLSLSYYSNRNVRVAHGLLCCAEPALFSICQTIELTDGSVTGPTRCYSAAHLAAAMYSDNEKRRSLLELKNWKTIEPWLLGTVVALWITTWIRADQRIQ